MENVVNRHRNLILLVAILFLQVIGLAVQVKAPTDHGSTSLIRLWAVRIITPGEKAAIRTSRWASGVWHNYLYLRGVRRENRELREEIQRLRLEQVRLAEDASQARRLQALLGFKEQYISQTLPAQVISTTGSEFSRGVYIDKGSKDGVRQDMPVITADGVVGKVIRVYPASALVLMINDSTSGAGVILEKSRLQGIVKGTPGGETMVQNIMSDEKVEPGERVLTSGGDRVFPKGMPVGVVTDVLPGNDLFLRVRIKPAARLDRLEEVLVITKVEERSPSVEEPSAPMRAVDILAQRLPSVPVKADDQSASKPSPASGVPAPTSNLPPLTRNLPPPAAAGANAAEAAKPKGPTTQKSVGATAAPASGTVSGIEPAKPDVPPNKDRPR